MLKLLDAPLTWSEALILFATFWLTFTVASVTHELGHYFMARIFGIHPESVVLGSYVTVYDRVVAETRFVVRAVSVPWDPKHVDFSPGKYDLYAMIWVLSAGMLVNAASAVLVGSLAWAVQSRILLFSACCFFAFVLGQALPIGPTSDGVQVWSLVTQHQLRQ